MSRAKLICRQQLFWLVCVAALAAMSLSACEPGGPVPEPELDAAEAVQADAALALTEAAIAAYDQDPDGTLEAISDPQGPWRIGELYIFVSDASGVIVAHAANTGLIGEDLYESVDSDGYPFLQELLQRATEDGGWDIFRFTNPVTGQSEPKRAYVRRIDDGLIFGAGYYLDEPRFVKHIVADAVSVWNLDPDPAKTIQSEARFNRGESYVFAVRARDLVSLATQAEPELVGTSLADLTDYTGAKIAQEMRSRADGDGEWIFYGYQNPHTGEIQDKQSWVVRVGEAIVGAGIFSPR